MKTLVLCAALLCASLWAASAQLTLEQAKAAGVAYYASRCADQQVLLADLETALNTGNLETARAAYIASRPPYEEIEVLATADDVGPLDERIDARPYSFDGGEDNPLFQGFHVIERALYRDLDIPKAQAALVGLIDAVNSLCVVLNDGSTITPENSLDGQVALAFEVPAKKDSSEEETWSDASLMIFRHNWIGIYSQFVPFKQAGLDPAIAERVDRRFRQLRSLYNRIDRNGFGAANGVSRKYSDVGTRQRARLFSVAYSFALALRDARADLITVAPGEEEEEDDVRIIPESVGITETLVGVAELSRQCGILQTTLADLITAVGTGNIRTARAAYPAARIPYEQIEVFASAFEDEDFSIDARPDGYEFGEESTDWRGMHKVERELYRDNDLSGAASSLAAVQVTVDSLCVALNESVRFDADGAFKGMIGLSTEVPAKKISSEEETWSDLSLMIFRENQKGVKALYDPFRPLLSRATSLRCDRRLRRIQSSWEDAVDRNNDWATGLNFRAYSDVPTFQRRRISNQFYQLARCLADAQAEVAASS